MSGATLTSNGVREAAAAAKGEAAQAAQNGDTVLVIEKNAEISGNTLVSGSAYQSVMPYLCWEADKPDATTSEYRGSTYDKVKYGNDAIETLHIVANWSEESFDGEYYKDHEYEADDIGELSEYGIHADFLPTLQALKQEINAYLAWAELKLAAGAVENTLTLFSTIDLHIFQTYYGGLR